MARSTRDLLNVLATVSERGAGFRSLSDPWADATTPHNGLLLTVLGGLAEFERSLILARIGEGRSRAMARGYVSDASRSSLPFRSPKLSTAAMPARH
jgi:DNA invertase Pin-like site-specific DNA recombinase